MILRSGGRAGNLSLKCALKIRRARTQERPVSTPYPVYSGVVKGNRDRAHGRKGVRGQGSGSSFQLSVVSCQLSVSLRLGSWGVSGLGAGNGICVGLRRGAVVQ